MGELVLAYVRRKRFEARLVAAEVGKLFASGDKRNERISSDEMLRMMGVG